ncbi:c-type cytochrome [Methylobacterium aquaticum]|uniref:c-type cytochrome n=1 Tax=Methylobacterium aquaticum TaxID=270351 RepID=UPI003D167996
MVRGRAPSRRRSRGIWAGRRLLLCGALLVSACADDDGGERRRALGDRPTLEAAMRVADSRRGGRLFGRCAACHTIGPGAGDRNGPNLFAVMNKPMASNSPRYGYTAALRALGGTWTPEAMDRWLADPMTVAPGTRMRFEGLADPLDRADVIAYLHSQSAGTASTR